MLSAAWLVFAVILAILLTAWVILTLTRLDRLHARVDAAQAAMDAQLVRRAAAVQHLGETGLAPPDLSGQLAEVARSALAASAAGADRQVAENRVGHAITELASYRGQLPAEAVNELSEAATRVLIARRFFNDAVRDTRTLRARRMPRLLHLAGRRELPQYFDIDDSSLFAHDVGSDPASQDNPIANDNR